MSKALIWGITSKSPKSLIWNSMPNGCYVVVRNRSFDDKVFITQEVKTNVSIGETSVVNTKSIKVALPVMQEASFFIADKSLKFEIGTYHSYSINDRYKCLSALVSSDETLTNETGQKVFIIDVLHRLDYNLITEFTNKGSAFYMLNRGEQKEIIEAHNESYPIQHSYRENDIAPVGQYECYFLAGRGFMLNSIVGLNKVDDTGTDNIFTQTLEIDAKVGVDDSSRIDQNVTINVLEIPYVKTTREAIAEAPAFNAELGKVDIDWTPSLGKAMFMITPGDNSKYYPRALNFKNNSGIDKVGTSLESDLTGAQVLQFANLEFIDLTNGTSDSDYTKWRIPSLFKGTNS